MFGIKLYMLLCPSSGVFHHTHSNGVCRTGLLTACELDQGVWNKTLHVSDGSSVHHQEFFTVHTQQLVHLVCFIIRINNSPPSSAEVKNEWSYTSTPSICLHGMDNDSRTLLPYTVYLCEMSTADTDC